MVMRFHGILKQKEIVSFGIGTLSIYIQKVLNETYVSSFSLLNYSHLWKWNGVTESVNFQGLNTVKYTFEVSIFSISKEELRLCAKKSIHLHLKIEYMQYLNSSKPAFHSNNIKCTID